MSEPALVASLARIRLQARIMLLALRRSGSRALLALAAVGAGIAATMVLMALSTGAERELEAAVAQIGRNLFVVVAAPVLALPGRGGGWSVSPRLDRDDVAALRDGVRDIRAIAPILEGSRRARLGGQEIQTSVRGVTPEFLALRNFTLARGRAFDESDERSRARVALVGSFVAEKLGEGTDLVGRAIWVGGVPFEVVGLLAAKGMSDGQNEDDQILVPLETARRRLFNSDSLSRLLIQTGSAEGIPVASQRAREILRSTHRLDASARDDFEILALLRVNQIRRQSSAFLRGLSQIFAVTTLVVGGAGVLAVTYLNAKERVSEVGLRMAVGARRRDIAALFVGEACVLSVAGGLLGIALGALAVVLLERTLGWRMAIDLRGVVIPLLVSVALGLLFGVAPAMQAARVTPMEALRDA